MSLGWTGNARARGRVWGEGSLGVPAQTAAAAAPDKQKMDEWMSYQVL